MYSSNSNINSSLIVVRTGHGRETDSDASSVPRKAFIHALRTGEMKIGNISRKTRIYCKFPTYPSNIVNQRLPRINLTNLVKKGKSFVPLLYLLVNVKKKEKKTNGTHSLRIKTVNQKNKTLLRCNPDSM